MREWERQGEGVKEKDKSLSKDYSENYKSKSPESGSNNFTQFSKNRFTVYCDTKFLSYVSVCVWASLSELVKETFF